MKRSTASTLLIVLAWTGLNLAPAFAREKVHRDAGYAKACSRYGNGCVSGPVRTAKYGQQVRLRSGTWIDCKGDCGEALLEETIDFWDSQAIKARAAF